MLPVPSQKLYGIDDEENGDEYYPSVADAFANFVNLADSNKNSSAASNASAWSARFDFDADRPMPDMTGRYAGTS